MARYDEIPPEDRWFWEQRTERRIIDVPTKPQNSPARLFVLTLVLILCAVIAWPIIVVLGTLAIE